MRFRSKTLFKTHYIIFKREDCVEENEQRPNVDEVSETKDCRDSALGGSEYEENQNVSYSLRS